MKKISELLIVAVLITLVAPVIAELPPDGVDTDQGVEHLVTESAMKPMDPHYIWINSLAVDLSGVNPVIFQNAEFSKDPDGMSSGNLLTASISKFLNSDPNAGDSKVFKNVAKVGLTHWPGLARNSS
jgi:hypothetical protein